MTDTNTTILSQLSHRTIRAYDSRPVPKAIMTLLFEVAGRTATSNGMQQFSIIHITDPDKKAAIAEVAKQAYIKDVPEVMIFVVDQYRNTAIAREKKVKDLYGHDMDRFFQGFTDACIAAQNMVNAAESLGLGTMYMGSILNDAAHICQLLHLPELTFPVVGLGVGYPGQNPEVKPRLESKLKVFENTYQPKENYLEAIKDYDAQMQTYYDLRIANQRVDAFSDQVASKYQNFIVKRQALLSVIQAQGFDTNRHRKD